MRTSTEAAGWGPSMEGLPDAVLADVFSRLPFDERRQVVPCVCKRWNALSCNEHSIWRTCFLSGRELSRCGSSKVDWRQVVNWFVRRSRAVEALHIFKVDFRTAQMPALLPMLMALLCHSLKFVKLTMCQFSCGALDGLLCLCWLRQLRVQLTRSLPTWEPVGQLSCLQSLEVLDVGFSTWPKEKESRLETGSMLVNFPQRLTELRLTSWGCVSAVVPPDAFHCWGHLELIDLSGTEVQMVPESGAHLSSLGTLSINNEQILPSFTMLTSLRTVAIENPTSVAMLATMTWLESLCLHCMEATDVELQGLSGLSALASLLLGCCELHSVPEPVVGLSTLTELSLWGNSISTLPPGCYLSSLTSLDLTKNDFTAVPGVLAHSTGLVRLDLSENGLLQLGDDAVDLLLGLSCLESLSLGGNSMAWSQESARSLVRLAQEKSNRLAILM
ncbi:unnamed protein product [Ostreobium quekettii]|uniref:F-box domain-containing protein n=1 Tax=Ostreobium quekettii TaxID=121088 RepID=A0A8S1J229_9CHLO|nr:unnamed protein product [Ostreobium quekettii]